LAAAIDQAKHFEKALSSLFKGKKAKWLPLFSRLAARLSRVPGIELHVTRATITLNRSKKRVPAIAVIRVIPEGLKMNFAFGKRASRSVRLLPITRKNSRMTHQILISELKEIDDEILLWIQAALHQVRTAKRRSI